MSRTRGVSKYSDYISQERGQRTLGIVTHVSGDDSHLYALSMGRWGPTSIHTTLRTPYATQIAVKGNLLPQQ